MNGRFIRCREWSPGNCRSVYNPYTVIDCIPDVDATVGAYDDAMRAIQGALRGWTSITGPSRRASSRNRGNGSGYKINTANGVVFRIYNEEVS